MKIKTFPLQFTEGYLKRIEKAAGKRNKTKFIYDAIEKALREQEAQDDNT